MKHFKNFKQLKYTIIFLAGLFLLVWEIFNWVIFGQSLTFVVINLVVGLGFIIAIVQVVFHFSEEYKNQLALEVKERHEIETRLLLRSSALEAAANAIAITDVNGRFMWINPAFTQLTGYEFSEAMGNTPALLKSGKQDEAFYHELWQTVLSGKAWQGELINRKKNGRLYTEEQIITPVVNEAGQVTNFIAIKHDITNRKQAEEKLQQYTERLRLMHSIDQAILSKQAPDEIARVVLDYAYQMIPCNRASVTVLDEIKYEGSVLAVLQDGETTVASGYTFRLSEIEIRILLSPEKANPVEIVDLDNPLTNTGKKIKTEGISTYIKIPLIAQGKLIGFFNLGSMKKGTFSEEHMSIAQDIATSLAIALQQSRLYMVERHQRQQAEALREIGEALSSTLNFDEILNLLLGQIIRAVHYDSAHIILIDGDEATIHYTRGYERYGPEVVEKVTSLVFNVSETPNLKWIIDHQQPLIIPDIHQYPGWRKEKGISQTRSWVGVPIVVEDKISVLIALSRQQPNYYNDTHVNTLRAFASQVGLALENARLYEELRSYTDELEDRVKARTRALADANERLKELDRLKSKFISDVSHELRTPITNVTMYLDLLERGSSEKHDHYMTVLKQETRRLSQLIEDIFDESQYTNHLQQAEYDLVDINEVVYRTIKFYQRETGNAGLILTYELEASLPLVWGEGHQLGQVISNLLKNAMTYTPFGEICITTKQEDHFVTISVDDTGVGIAPEDMPHLFDRFYRGQHVSQSTIPGTGLGLGVVREIVELHGGGIEASNNANGGATFRVFLPSSQVLEDNLLTYKSQ